jgi:hypothetical protein
MAELQEIQPVSVFFYYTVNVAHVYHIIMFKNIRCQWIAFVHLFLQFRSVNLY